MHQNKRLNPLSPFLSLSLPVYPLSLSLPVFHVHDGCIHRLRFISGTTLVYYSTRLLIYLRIYRNFSTPGNIISFVPIYIRYALNNVDTLVHDFLVHEPFSSFGFLFSVLLGLPRPVTISIPCAGSSWERERNSISTRF